MEQKQPFSAAIKSARIKAKLSLQKAADGAQITKAHLWSMEDGDSCNPTAVTLWRLGSTLGVAPSTLLKLAIAQKILTPTTAQHEEGGA